MERFGDEAHAICDVIVRVVKSLRASGGVPKGDRLKQYEIAIKYAVATGKISFDAGEFLLGDLTDRTVNAILRVRAADPDKVDVWRLEAQKK